MQIFCQNNYEHLEYPSTHVLDFSAKLTEVYQTGFKKKTKVKFFDPYWPQFPPILGKQRYPSKKQYALLEYSWSSAFKQKLVKI